MRRFAGADQNRSGDFFATTEYVCSKYLSFFMQRRAFLRRSSAILLTPALLAAACAADDPQPGLGKKVVVVGAGLAGIHAAHLLLKKGFEVEILEASDRWGGRIRALTGFADFPIELGAEEIHGEKSDWHRLVKSTPGVLFADAEDADFYWLDNALRTEAYVQGTPDGAKALAFIDAAQTYSGGEKTVRQHAENQGIEASVSHFVNAQIGNEFGTSNERLSIKGIAEEGELWTAGDENRFVANRSYQQIIEANFADALAKISLNTPVKSIDYSTSKIKITDAAGLQHEADYALVTVPLPVLRDGDIVFSPALPIEKTEAFQKIGMGAGMKIILKFSQRFWAADTGSIYGAGPVPEYWYTSLGRGTTPVLTAFVMGEKAEQLSSLGDAALQVVLADLDAMYGAEAASTAFVEARVMDWSKEPHIRGAYSFPVVGGGILMRQRLAAPLSGKVFFAGEATHSGGHSGTAHGAFESAVRAVAEIIG